MSYERAAQTAWHRILSSRRARSDGGVDRSCLSPQRTMRFFLWLYMKLVPWKEEKKCMYCHRVVSKLYRSQYTDSFGAKDVQLCEACRTHFGSLT